jgi:hypothetical protein
LILVVGVLVVTYALIGRGSAHIEGAVVAGQRAPIAASSTGSGVFYPPTVTWSSRQPALRRSRAHVATATSGNGVYYPPIMNWSSR